MVPTRTYLAATTVAGVALTRAERTDRASHVLAGPSPDLRWTVGVRDRVIGSTTDPLDGGARTGERAGRGAGHLPPFRPPWPLFSQVALSVTRVKGC
jgi:hypothetical protein